ncbi:MAG: hypothetical protein AAGI24_02650 [Pseudomonadota bacterium]
MRTSLLPVDYPMRASGRGQKGFALLALLTIFVLALTTVLIARVSVNEQDARRQVSNAGVLAEATAALVGYAVRQQPPGTLPCPDVNGDGLADPQGNGCQSQRGLLPARTLGTDALRDRSGASLWYAVELAYVGTAAGTRNPSRVPTLQLDGQPVAAVVIAPNAPFEGQGRAVLNASDFLEGENADASLASYASLTSDVGNDQVLGLRTGPFWTDMARIALAEAGRTLQNYRLLCGEYPWASVFGGPYTSVNGLQIGSIPMATAEPFDWGDPCPGGTAPLPVAWLVTHWSDQIFYRMCQSAEGSCLSTQDNGLPPVTGPASSVVLLSPGAPLAGQVRPSSLESNYFEGQNVAVPDTLFSDLNLIEHNASYNDVTLFLSP